MRLLDGYKLQLPIKGGFTYARWRRVIITSNDHPDDWYKKYDLSHPQFNRRIDKIVDTLVHPYPECQCDDCKQWQSMFTEQSIDADIADEERDD